MAAEMRKITFVIPVYRAEDTVVELYQRISRVFAADPNVLEIIFVEDCGEDHSWKSVAELAESDDRVKAFRMSRNFGQHNALLCGIRAASGGVIVTIDDDLQHPPEVVPQLIAKLDEGFDVVYGSPEKEQHGFLRDIASQLTKYSLQSSMGADIAMQVSALRVFRTRLREAFQNYNSPTVNIDVLLTWGTTNFTAVRVPHETRKFGISGYTTSKLIKHAFNMITGFSTAPLQVASAIGLSFSIFGFAILIYLLARWAIFGSVVPGFVFIASMIALFSGSQLLALGVMGEYIARMHLKSMGRPAYLVAQQDTFESGPE